MKTKKWYHRASDKAAGTISQGGFDDAHARLPNKGVWLGDLVGEHGDLSFRDGLAAHVVLEVELPEGLPGSKPSPRRLHRSQGHHHFQHGPRVGPSGPSPRTHSRCPKCPCGTRHGMDRAFPPVGPLGEGDCRLRGHQFRAGVEFPPFASER